jgi:hypothetical protein
MSHENVEVIQRVYEAAANGDVLGLAWLDERFAFEYRSAPELSSGPETVNDPKWRPERYIDLKGRILVQVKLLGRGSETGDEIQRRIGHLWNIQGRPVRLVVYQDWESGLEAAGVEE